MIRIYIYSLRINQFLSGEHGGVEMSHSSSKYKHASMVLQLKHTNTKHELCVKLRVLRGVMIFNSLDVILQSNYQQLIYSSYTFQSKAITTPNKQFQKQYNSTYFLSSFRQRTE